MKRILNLVLCALLTSCAANVTPLSPTQPPSTQTIAPPVKVSNYQVPITDLTQTPKPTPIILRTLTPTATGLPEATSVHSEGWKTLPVIPTADSSIREIYEYGQSLGNDLRAFSIFGDCQSRPEAFFGVFETDPSLVSSLSPELQEVVNNFHGSFNRESPTSQDGTTPGALLWTQWHRGEYGCTFAETPVQCELRIHHPSFVIIQIGTHFESRNTEYLRKVILQLLDAGVVPILATKADNREKDERINRDMSMLAAEYDLSLWNFWAALSDLPGRGLYVMKGREGQGPVYLNHEASLRHRMTGIEALSVVWRAMTDTSR